MIDLALVQHGESWHMDTLYIAGKPSVAAPVCPVHAMTE